MGPSELPNGTPFTSIVLADNDKLILEAIGELLRSKNYEVYLAHDGLEAWQRIREIRPTCVILDVMMPKLDGSRVCWMIRQDPTLRDTPIIVFSSLSPHDFRHFPELSADAYVAKGEMSLAFQNLLRAMTHLQAKGRADIAGGILGYDNVQPRKIVAEMLQEIRRYANVLSALGPGTIELDADGLILRLSAGACEILGRGEAQLIGEPVTSLCAGRDQETLLHLLRELSSAAQSEQRKATVQFGDLAIPIHVCSIWDGGHYTGALLIMESKGKRVDA
jgi:two-component system, cell cycle sensor histidine kinase and response regulator CckA